MNLLKSKLTLSYLSSTKKVEYFFLQILDDAILKWKNLNGVRYFPNGIFPKATFQVTISQRFRFCLLRRCDLGSCRLGNCSVGKLSFEKLPLGKKPLEKYLTSYRISTSYLINATADWQIDNKVLQVESIIPPSRETLQKTIPLAEVKLTKFL